MRYARSLLVCVMANAHLGDDVTARHLEERADELEIRGYGLVLDAPRIQLALVRGELGTVARLLETQLAERGWYRGWMALATIVTRLDGFAAIGDARRVEEVAASCLRPRTYLEPFALRALGIVRQDDDLIARARARFEALGLHWHASQTEPLA